MFKQIIATLILSSIFVVIAFADSPQFPDTAGSDYGVAVEFLYERGVVNGYPDGTFRYWKTVNRAELLKIILESKFNVIPETPDTNCGFFDVQPNEWYSKYVCFAENHGIIQGYPDGSFQPTRTVNLVEALKITEIAYGWETTEPSDEWYRNYIELAGYNIPEVTSFDQNLTRGQMADMITRFIKQEEGDLWDYLDRIEERNSFPLTNYECLKNRTCPILIDIPASRNRQKLLENAMTPDQKKEKITFVVNQEVVDRSSNWKINAQNLIEAYNDILSVNTEKQLEIGKFVVLSDFQDLCKATQHPEYFLKNENYGGLTIFYTIGGGPISCPIFINGIVARGVNLGSYVGNFGIVYMLIDLESEEVPSMDSLPSLTHEMGHAYGLGSPEWYNYFRNAEPIEDGTGTLPNLGEYIPTFMNGNIDEPMIAAASPTPYSELNAFILNHNGNHKFDIHDIASTVSDEVVVKVVDRVGTPVSNATVEVYGMRTNAMQERYGEPQPLLETVITNAKGEASISRPANTQTLNVNPDAEIEYTVKATKVSKNGTYAGAYYSTLDLQYSTLIEGKNVYEINLVLE